MASTIIETKSYWLKHIKGYKASGLPSKSAYCLQAGVSYHRFIYWSEKLVQELNQGKTTPKEEQFVPVQLAVKSKPKSSEPLCILELKQGHRLLIHNEAVLGKVFFMLSK